MGDSAEFEKLTALEARLASALDRIAAGVAGGLSAPVASEGADAEAARQDAEARAAELAERVEALETRLTETQSALADAQAEAMANARAAADAPAVDPDAFADLQKQLEAAQAAQALAETARDEALAAQAAGPDDEIEKKIAVLERRIVRAREERDEARSRADLAQDKLDEMLEDGAEAPDDRILALRRDLRLMRERAETLAAEVATLTGGGNSDAEIEAGLLAEVQTLRQLREVEAAELQRIVEDMEQGLNTTDEVTHG